MGLIDCVRSVANIFAHAEEVILHVVDAVRQEADEDQRVIKRV